uniref:Tudor domain-containing protein n=1 Tax=Elaeophora elaphi TaxID=1147741 RepID=A0A0R3RW61_9BILA
MKSLWLRRDGFSVRLMARTKEPPVSLLLPLDSCFDVRILRIDYTDGLVFVRPVAEDEQYGKLQQKLMEHSSAEQVRAEHLTEDTIYLASNNGVFRGTLVGHPSTMSLFYSIDAGEMTFLNAQSICQLPSDLQSIPPLCFCGLLLPDCATSLDHVDLSSINEGSICLCKIYKVPPPNFSDYPMIYPPVVFIQLYKFTDNNNKYVEIIFKPKSEVTSSNNEYLSESSIMKRRNGQSIEKAINLFQRSSHSDDQFIKADDNVMCNKMRCFTFKPYNIKLPSQVRAIVTEKIRHNLYWMRDADILAILSENLVDPVKHSKYKSINLVDWHNEICCLIRPTRPFRECNSYHQFSVYRAVITHFREETDTCSAYLVDFGLSVTCSIKNLYSCKEQPAVIREISSAAFRCYVNRIAQQGSGESRIPKARHFLFPILNQSNF